MIEHDGQAGGREARPGGVMNESPSAKEQRLEREHLTGLHDTPVKDCPDCDLARIRSATRQIVFGPTVTGAWNLLGIEEGEFFVQGNLTRDQMVQLRGEIDAALEEDDQQ